MPAILSSYDFRYHVSLFFSYFAFFFFFWLKFKEERSSEKKVRGINISFMGRNCEG